MHDFRQRGSARDHSRRAGSVFRLRRSAANHRSPGADRPADHCRADCWASKPGAFWPWHGRPWPPLKTVKRKFSLARRRAGRRKVKASGGTARQSFRFHLNARNTNSLVFMIEWPRIARKLSGAPLRNAALRQWRETWINLNFCSCGPKRVLGPGAGFTPKPKINAATLWRSRRISRFPPPDSPLEATSARLPKTNVFRA